MVKRLIMWGVLALICSLAPLDATAASHPGGLQWAEMVTGVDGGGNPTTTEVFGYYADAGGLQVFIACDPATGEETGEAYVPGAVVGERKVKKFTGYEYVKKVDTDRKKYLYAPKVFPLPLWKGDVGLSLATYSDYIKPLQITLPYGDDPARWPEYWKWIFYPLENKNGWPVEFRMNADGNYEEGYLSPGETKYFRRVLSNEECSKDKYVGSFVRVDVTKNYDPEAPAPVGPEGYYDWPAWWGEIQFDPLWFNGYLDKRPSFAGLWTMEPCFKKIPKFIPDAPGSSIGILAYDTIPAYRWVNTPASTSGRWWETNSKVGFDSAHNPSPVGGRLVPYDPALPGPVYLYQKAVYEGDGPTYSTTRERWETLREEKYPRRIPISTSSSYTGDLFFADESRTKVVVTYTKWGSFYYKEIPLKNQDPANINPFEGKNYLVNGDHPSYAPAGENSKNYYGAVHYNAYSWEPYEVYVTAYSPPLSILGSYSQVLNVTRDKDGHLKALENRYFAVFYNPTDHPMKVTPLEAWMIDDYDDKSYYGKLIPETGTVVIPPNSYGVIPIRGIFEGTVPREFEKDSNVPNLDGVARLGHPGESLMPGSLTPVWSYNEWMNGLSYYDGLAVSLEAEVTDNVVGVDSGPTYRGDWLDSAYKIDGYLFEYEKAMTPEELVIFANARLDGGTRNNVLGIIQNGVCTKKMRTLGSSWYWTYVYP
ncbi:hypothetical protein [Neomoorella thermoacetica]|uniref:hypothetical protein n=1 Tax=Neomoorella thermoacetica TaxID=1525 RepID=UPI0008FBABB3|nr:hypothetical protein [Moorella thermoacetica]OIQ59921.1 hypothetical protein MTIN_20930 [Moorella thermoacetica]